MNLLKVENLTKTYPKFKLDSVSLSVNKGEIVGFIGRNGAGKSTTIKSIMGFVHKDYGNVEFFGQKFEGNENKIKQSVGFIDGGVNYYPSVKIGSLADVTRRFYDNWSEDTKKALFEKFELDIAKTPSQLSAGMKVKLALAMALSHNAKLLILDEPTSGLDPISRDELLDIFLKLKEQGVGILFSTHIITDLERIADRIVYIKDGKIFTDKALPDFKDEYRILFYTKRPEGIKLIGERRENDGYSALVLKDVGIGEKVALEDIMLHLEREDG